MPGLPNLREQFLAEKLPSVLMTLDERGLLAAVLGGIQDRVEDLRAHIAQFDQLLAPTSAEVNAVFVDFRSPQGVAVTRSLRLQETTPTLTDTSALRSWALAETGLNDQDVDAVRVGYDALRAIQAPILEHLARTVGATLHVSDAARDGAAEQLLFTWFPRLRRKGTSSSFELLGRILGFDDILVTPLWGRLSPRRPDDIGHPECDADFAYVPEYLPQQALGPLYDPHVMRDGAYFEWSGTVTNDPTRTDFYTSVLQGKNPFISVTPLVTTTPVHPQAGSYALDHGGPHSKAYVEPAGSDFRFTTLGEGSSWNNLSLIFEDVVLEEAGTHRVLTVADRLSAIKYRTSYFDLAIATNIETAGAVFGERNVQPSPDLEADPSLNSATDGVAVSPYRPFVSGSVTTGLDAADWVTSLAGDPAMVVIPRTQAEASDGELRFDAVRTAASQVLSAMEEVRPATRFVRRSEAGLVAYDTVPYARYLGEETILTTVLGQSLYTGSTPPLSPAPGWTAELDIAFPSIPAITWNGTLGQFYFIDQSPDGVGSWTALGGVVTTSVPQTYYFASFGDPFFRIRAEDNSLPPQSQGTSEDFKVTVKAEEDDDEPGVYRYKYGPGWGVTNLYFTGSYASDTGQYLLNFQSAIVASTQVVAKWTATDTDTIRDEPDTTAKVEGRTQTQPRPEDEEGEGLPYEVVDQYFGQQAVVGGGEWVDAQAYVPGEGEQVVSVSQETHVFDQSGAPYEAYVRVDAEEGHHRFVPVLVDTGPTYQPGQWCLGYRGDFRDLSTLTETETELLQDQTSKYDLLFEPGYELFKVGLVYGVMVAHPERFFGPHFRDGYVAWLPLNEHPEDSLTIREASGLPTQVFELTPTQRVWDADRGHVLQPSSTFSLELDAQVELEEAWTLAFMVDMSTPGATEVVDLVSSEVFRLSLDASSGDLSAYALDSDANWQLVGTHGLLAGWAQVYLKYSEGTVHFGYGGAEVDLALEYTLPLETLTLRGSVSGVRVQDLRLWSVEKTTEALALNAEYLPTSTVAPYPLGTARSVDRRDRYGFRVLSSGYVVPGRLPAGYPKGQFKRVRRFDSYGRYTGPNRFHAAGLGVGQSLQSRYGLTQYPLGYALPYVHVDGTVTHSGTTALADFNELWSEGDTGNYVALSGGYSSSGSLAVTVVRSDPATRLNENTTRPFFWLEGEDATVYRVFLDGSRATTKLRAVQEWDLRSDAEVQVNPVYASLLSSGTYTDGPLSAVLVNGTQAEITLDAVTTTVDLDLLVYRENLSGIAGRVNDDGFLTIIATGSTEGIVTRDPTSEDPWTGMELLLSRRTVDAFSDAYSAWIGGGVAYNADLFGNQVEDHPEYPQPVAALDQAGQLDFQCSGDLAAGAYILTLTSGNIGLLDADFSGFSVEILINSQVIPARLLTSGLGLNPTGTDVIRFTLANATLGGYVLSVRWLNALRDDARGQARQLAVFAFTLERQVSEKFALGPTPPDLVDTTPTPGVYTASESGGWLHAVQSDGNLLAVSHEVLQARVFLSGTEHLCNQLTGSTNDRFDSVVVSEASGSALLAAETVPALPTLGSLVDS